MKQKFQEGGLQIIYDHKKETVVSAENIVPDVRIVLPLLSVLDGEFKKNCNLAREERKASFENSHLQCF